MKVLVIMTINTVFLFPQGHIFWGRKTLCNKTDKKLLEKIPGAEGVEEEKFTLQN